MYKIKKNKILYIMIPFLVIISCASTPDTITPDIIDTEKNVQPVNKNTDLQINIINTAQSLLGKKPNQKVMVNGKSFILDCIGTISAIYWGAHIDLTKDFGLYDGNGVNRLYQSFLARNLLHVSKTPEVGDIIFWDNTWDRNGNKKFGDDPLTHVGLVLSVDSDSTITYIHENYVTGIVLEKMNLEFPKIWKDVNGKILNSPLYLASYYGNPKNPTQYLAGDLWKAFGSAAKVESSYGLISQVINTLNNISKRIFPFLVHV